MNFDCSQTVQCNSSFITLVCQCYTVNYQLYFHHQLLGFDRLSGPNRGFPLQYRIESRGVQFPGVKLTLALLVNQ